MLHDHIITMVQCYFITSLNDGLMLLLVMLILSNAYTIVIVFSYLIWLKDITITVMLKLVDIHIFLMVLTMGILMVAMLLLLLVIIGQ